VASAKEEWDRFVERSKKESAKSPPKEKDRNKDPYEISRDLTFFGESGHYVGGRKLSEKESDDRYAAGNGSAAMGEVERKRALAAKKGYGSIGEMNYYEKDDPVLGLAERYVSGKSGTSSSRNRSGDIDNDPSVDQYYRDDKGRGRVMLLPKMQYQTGVNQQIISNEKADRAFQAQQDQLQFENERRLVEWEAAQRQQEFANQMAQRQFGLQEGQLTGRYRSQDVSNLLNQLAALKQQGSAAGQSSDYYAGLKSQADTIRNQLAMQGLDTSGIGSSASLDDFYRAAGQMYNPTLGAQEMNQRGQQFSQEHAFRQQQAEIENALRREQFERSKFESDRAHSLDLSKLRVAQTKASQPSTPKVSKQQTYADALADFKQYVEEAKQAGTFQGAARMEQELFSNPAFIQNLVAQGYDLDAAVDALYNAATNGQMRTKKDALDYAKQVEREAKQRLEEEYAF